MEHLQRVWLASRERLPLRTPGSVPLFGGLTCALIVETSFPRLYTNLMTVPNLTFTELRGFHGAFATGVASQQGALTLPDTWFRPPFWDLLMLQLLRPNSSSLPCLCSTFHLEYPLVLSRFCPLRPMPIVSYQFCPVPTCAHHVFCTLFINRQLFISRDIQSCDCIFDSRRKG